MTWSKVLPCFVKYFWRWNSFWAFPWIHGYVFYTITALCLNVCFPYLVFGFCRANLRLSLIFLVVDCIVTLCLRYQLTALCHIVLDVSGKVLSSFIHANNRLPVSYLEYICFQYWWMDFWISLAAQMWTFSRFCRVTSVHDLHTAMPSLGSIPLKWMVLKLMEEVILFFSAFSICYLDQMRHCLSAISNSV